MGSLAAIPSATRPRASFWLPPVSRHLFGLAAKVAVSALGVWLVLARVDFAATRASVAAASGSGLALAAAAFLLLPLLGGLRWWLVLRGLGEPSRLGSVTAVFSTATVAGQLLPSFAGDGLRAWLASRRGHALPVALHSVALERVFMVLALLLLALATAPLLEARTGTAGPVWIAPVWIAATLLAAGAAGLGVLTAADTLPGRALAWRPLRALARRAAPTRALLWSRWGAGTALVSLLANLNFALAAALLARALALPVTALDILAIMPAVTLATTLPISFGGWGVRESLLVLLLGRLGVPAADALTLSLMFGGFSLVCGMPGLLAWCLDGRRSWTGAASGMSDAFADMATCRPGVN
jgi:uncharacterized membrane protein YbhN (UPF0104 family)